MSWILSPLEIELLESCKEWRMDEFEIDEWRLK